MPKKRIPKRGPNRPGKVSQRAENNSALKSVKVVESTSGGAEVPPDGETGDVPPHAAACPDEGGDVREVPDDTRTCVLSAPEDDLMGDESVRDTVKEDIREPESRVTDTQTPVTRKAESPRSTQKQTSPKGDKHGTVPIKHFLNNKLAELIIGEDEGELDSSYYPVLVVNTPSAMYSPEEMERNLGFTARVDWKVVFDSDPNSNKNGLCQFVKNKSKHPVKILSPNTFVESEERDISTLREGIGFPEETAWVFCNGRHDVEEKIEEKMTDKQWTKHRSDAVQRTVQFFANPKVIPEDRAVVIFLLLSDSDILVLSQIFRQFYISKSFDLHNFTIMAEDEQIIQKFIDKLEEMDVVDTEDIEKRCFGGVPWQDINVRMSVIVGAGEAPNAELPMYPSGSCSLSKNKQNQWSDLTVLAKNECKDSSRNEDDEKFKDFVAEKERKFYQGHGVDWWNFHLSEDCYNKGKGFNHVMKRQHHEKLKSEMDNALKYDGKATDDIPLVTVFHEAGAGGTTLAKHVLWDIHRKVRCAVVNRITCDTVNQIVALRNHGYGNLTPGPTVLMLDNVNSENLGDLIDKLEKETRRSIQSVTVPFVILHCRRISDPENLHKNPCVAVQHKLSREEQLWLKRKTEDLEKREVFSEKDSPEQLLGFMVLKTQCNPDYLRNVVRRIIPKVHENTTEYTRNEVNLLKYIALIHFYKPDFIMPVPACDLLMRKRPLLKSYQKSKGFQRPKQWEKHLPKFLKLLLISVDISELCSVNGVRVVHSKIAKIIVEELGMVFDQTRADMFIEFLQSPIAKTTSHSKGYIDSVCQEMMKTRLKKEYGDAENTDFAPFIEDVYKHDIETGYREKTGTSKAIEILELGFQIYDDPYIAQHLARLYKIREKDYDKAESAINGALELNSTNSYLRDTKGLILMKKMRVLAQQGSSERLDEDEFEAILKVFQNASCAFQESQQCMKEETTGYNYAGFLNEMFNIFNLLDILQRRVKPFCFKDDGLELLRKYLTTDFIPTQYGFGHHDLLKSLKDHVEKALTYIEDYVNQCVVQSGSGTFRVPDVKLSSIYDRRRKFFKLSTANIAAGNGEHQAATACAGRRSEVKTLKCDGYYNVMRVAFDETRGEDLKEAQKLMRANLRSPTLFDVKNFVFTSFVLSVYQNEELDDDIGTWVQRLIEMENKTGGFYGLFFEMLLDWKNEVSGLQETIAELRRRWMKKHGKRTDESVQATHHRSKPQLFRSMKPRTEFFLGAEHGKRKFIHYKTIGKSLEDPDNIWREKRVQELLTRLNGFLENRNYLLYKTGKGSTIEIRLARPFHGIPGQERVGFFLGFSFAGPVAYFCKVQYPDSLFL